MFSAFTAPELSLTSSNGTLLATRAKSGELARSCSQDNRGAEWVKCRDLSDNPSFAPSMLVQYEGCFSRAQGCFLPSTFFPCEGCFRRASGNPALSSGSVPGSV